MQSQQNPGDQKNLLLAILLSIGVLLAWNYFYAAPRAQLEKERSTRIKKEQTQAKPKADDTTPDGSVPTISTGPAVSTGTPSAGSKVVGSPVLIPLTSRKSALAATARIALETPSLQGSINLTGGRIDDIKLVKYRETVDPTSPRIILFSPANAPQPYFAEHGWVANPGSNVKTPDRTTVWKVEGGKTTLKPNSPITLSWNNGQGQTFIRTITVDTNYLFTLKDSVKNTSGKKIILYPYARIYRYGTPKIAGFFIQHEGLYGFLGKEHLKELDYSEAIEDGGSLSFEKKVGGWLGFTDKYWAATLIPDQTVPYFANLLGKKKTATRKEYFQADYRQGEVIIEPNATKSVTSRLFVGAKKVDVINKYETEGKILELSYMIDWGWFYFITRPLYQLITWFYGVFGNFGLAILAVTVLVKAAFFYFANKSYESMAKMKKLQPKLEQLRERHKDDKAAQQKELMALYKTEKVNPLAGCLPVVIQIPVFFALYKVLFISIDMRHAPFFGWIQDLSSPDPTTLFNLFGLLPFAPPEIIPAVGVWPLLMGITMWLQMQLNPQQPDPVQQQVFNWMPVMFTFLLASFPAGLVIYWAWNNILSLCQQSFIMKRQGVDIPLVGNLRRNLGGIGKFFTSFLQKPKN